MSIWIGCVILAAAAGTCLAVLAIVYRWWLRWGAARQSAEAYPILADWPCVDVVVPVYNEAAWIGEKLANLARLRYPTERLRYWIVDGGSRDGTRAIVAAAIRNDPRFQLLSLGRADKTAQLNLALSQARGPWVMVTDADARLAPDTLLRLLAAAGAEPSIAVVGTTVTPRQAHPLESLHWRLVNRLLRWESERGCAGIVTAPCYVFRRALLTALPADVVADDIHVALLAAATGQRVAVVEAQVAELRSPVTLRQLLRHKLRKADAYLREVVRFAPRVRGMTATARQVFLWRAALLVLAPPLSALAGVGVAGAAAAAGVAGVVLALVGLATVTAAVGLGAASARPPVLRYAALGALLCGVLFLALLRLPFSHSQIADYRLRDITNSSWRYCVSVSHGRRRAFRGSPPLSRPCHKDGA